MLQHAQRHYNEDDYFAVEASSGVKHEFYQGEIFAMAGASLAHNHLSANVLTLLRGAVRPQGGSAFGSDLRVKTPDGLFTYPDVMVMCGAVALTRDRPDTVTNPCVIVEVLSEATRDYDRGEKFILYQAIPTLREYLLIEQDRVHLEHWRRQPSNSQFELLGRIGKKLAVEAVEHEGEERSPTGKTELARQCSQISKEGLTAH